MLAQLVDLLLVLGLELQHPKEDLQQEQVLGLLIQGMDLPLVLELVQLHLKVVLLVALELALLMLLMDPLLVQESVQLLLKEAQPLAQVSVLPPQTMDLPPVLESELRPPQVDLQ